MEEAKQVVTHLLLRLTTLSRYISQNSKQCSNSLACEEQTYYAAMYVKASVQMIKYREGCIEQPWLSCHKKWLKDVSHR
eukprot:scaffold350009_cov37-Prasinocladus_malaysianus.AAC.3